MNRLKANVYFYSPHDGGKEFISDKFQTFISMDDKFASIIINLWDSDDKIFTGNNVFVELIVPFFDTIEHNVKVGKEFKIQEGSRIIGEGTIVEIY